MLDTLPEDFSQRLLDAKYQEVSKEEKNENGVPFQNDLHIIICVVPEKLRGLVLLKNEINREYISALNCELLSQNKGEVAKRKNALELVNNMLWSELRPLLKVSLHKERPIFALTQDWKVVLVCSPLGIEDAAQQAEIEALELAATLPKAVVQM